jgi:hypothetical protein
VIMLQYGRHVLHRIQESGNTVATWTRLRKPYEIRHKCEDNIKIEFTNLLFCVICVFLCVVPYLCKTTGNSPFEIK